MSAQKILKDLAKVQSKIDALAAEAAKKIEAGQTEVQNLKNLLAQTEIRVEADSMKHTKTANKAKAAFDAVMQALEELGELE